MIGHINSNLLRVISRSIERNSRLIGDSLQRLSTGNRLLRTTEEPATQAFIERLNSQIRGVRQASLNVQQGQGLLTEADNALQSMSQIAMSLKDLATTASQSGLSVDERDLLQEEAALLKEQFESLANQTSFNGFLLLDGSFPESTLQVGAKAGDQISFEIGDARSTSLGTLSIVSGAQGALSAPISGGDNAVFLNNIQLSASLDDGFSTAGANQSALSIVRAINDKTNETGVSSEVVETERTLFIEDFGGNVSGALEEGDFVLNGVSIVGAVADVSDLAS